MTGRILIFNGKVITPSSIIEKGALSIEGGRIRKVSSTDEANFSWAEETIDAKGNVIAPGFIDLHVQGGGGWDVSDACYEAVEGMAENMTRHGTTAFLATSHADLGPITSIVEAIQRGTRGSQVLGIHLEGPFINVTKRGAIEEKFVKTPSLSDLREIIKTCQGTLRMMTLAPELDGAEELIRELIKKEIVVSLGHSEAHYEEAINAVQGGATQVTHIFNCMSALHHRQPGIVGASLTCDALMAQVIADGIHLHPQVVKMIFRTKGPEGIILITDGIRTVDMPDGEYNSLGRRVSVTKGEVRIEDGALAGSTLTMENAIKNMIDLAGASLSEAIAMATLNPARAMGIDNVKGSLENGKDADVVIFDQNFTVLLTMVKGETVYRNEERC